MPRLEDLVCPGHGDGDRGAETEADDEETTVAGPGVCGRVAWGADATSVGGQEKAEDLKADGNGEEEGAVVVEAVGERGDEKDGDEVHLQGGK